MNNLLKSAARKHALSNGIATAKWTDGDFVIYIKENGITERDNLKKTGNIAKAIEKQEHGKKATMGEIEAAIAAGRKQKMMDDLNNSEKFDIEFAKEEHKSAQGTSVEDAIKALVAASAPKAAELDEGKVIELIEKHGKGEVTHAHTVVIHNEEKNTKSVREGVHKDYALVMAHIAAKVDIALVGPAGSFKSTTLMNIATDLKLGYYIVSSPQARSEIVGYNDAHGNYVRTPMRDAYENGGLIVIEEYDGSSPKALLSANNLVANESTDFPDGMVERHPDFICVMAGNTFGTGASRQYVGRTQIDAATLDRFAFIEFGYDEDLEVKIAMAHHDAPETANWVKQVQSFRAAVEKSGIRHVVSPRASIMGAKLIKQGLPVSTIIKTILHKGLTSDQTKQLAR